MLTFAATRIYVGYATAGAIREEKRLICPSRFANNGIKWQDTRKT